MVSFSCEACGDVLTKKKLDPHRGRCRGATFTCIDCMVHFQGLEYRAHTSCMTEDQKYQGALYKNKKAKVANTPPAPKIMPQKAYVEDVEDEFEDYEYEDDGSDDEGSPAELMPEAPTPPPADEGPVNVFDFLDPSATPNASILRLPQDDEPEMGESTQLVRYEYDAHAYLDTSGVMVEEDPTALVQYGTGPIPATFQTPAAKGDRKKTKDSSEIKKDKKRKRLHVDTDHVMSDAPPVLHSGLTGGLNRMMRPVFPPSPDYSGGDGAEQSPASPLKKSKHSKHGKRSDGIGNNLLALMTTGSKTKSKKRKVSSKKHHSSHHRSDTEKAPKLIEYRPQSRDEKSDGDNQMVVFKPRADLFLSFINKGPESERGCSMNKALKRFHRERSSSGTGLGKTSEEKELWRSLRMRRNERGEIVLFCV